MHTNNGRKSHVNTILLPFSRISFPGGLSSGEQCKQASCSWRCEHGKHCTVVQVDHSTAQAHTTAERVSLDGVPATEPKFQVLRRIFSEASTARSQSHGVGVV